MKSFAYIFFALLVIALLAWKLCFPAGVPTAAPALARQWHQQVHGLDDDEVIRLVPPPFSQQRRTDLAGPSRTLPPQIVGQMAYHVRPSGPRRWGTTYADGNLSSAISWGSSLTRPELNILQEIRYLPVTGDWILRPDAPVEPRMKALESILKQATGKTIIIQKRLVERDVIIMRGSWSYQQDAAYPRLAAREQIDKPQPGAVQLYTLPLSPILGSGGGSGDLASFIEILESSTSRRFIDEVDEPRPKSIIWRNNSSQYRAAEDEKKLDQLLQSWKSRHRSNFSKPGA
jgi:hypothetical protein